MKTMKKLFIIICLDMLVFSCSPIHKSSSNDHCMNRQIHELRVRNFSEIPTDLLENLDRMGIDSSSIFNEYEGRYLNFIFKIDTNNFNLVGKKVGFIRSKADYFKETRERFYRNSTQLLEEVAYIFSMPLKKRKVAVMMRRLCIGVNFHSR